MATPRRSLARPNHSTKNSSLHTTSSPNLNASFSRSQRPPLPVQSSGLSASAVLARKASLNQLTSRTPAPKYDGGLGSGLTPTQEEVSSPFASYPTTPSMSRNVSGNVRGGEDIEVGDSVDVPGGMYGTVKFVGEVRGKKGVFAGVELGKEYVSRGKNDGDVEGTRYFTTSIPGSGIFLPLNKAYKRASRTMSNGSSPPTPITPSLASFNLSGKAGKMKQYTPPTPSISKFSQSVGPGRAASPAMFRPRRPSLSRPESPLRKAQNTISTPQRRPSLGAPSLSRNVPSGSRHAPTSTPGDFGASVRARKISISGDPGKKLGQNSRATSRPQANTRPASRSQSRMGPDPMFDEDPETTPTGKARTGNQHEDVHELTVKLGERDKQLKEQASSLAEMESSLAELQSLLPTHSDKSTMRTSRTSIPDDASAAQLRIALREKNDKIGMLTAEFDAHRADFRSTIDTLELASTETERVYERRVEELSQEVRELQDRGEDVESVARQLKQLEDLVQELEEGLEDARRGEAEARGEVEFLRGEVERGRSELRREREKAAAALKGAGAAADTDGPSREIEQRDDEIRGLKAIIHSLSRDSVPDADTDDRRDSRQRNGNHRTDASVAEELAHEHEVREQLEREIKELEGLVDRKTYHEEELERELHRLHNTNNNMNNEISHSKDLSSGSNGLSKTTIAPHKPNQTHESSATSSQWDDQSPANDQHNRHQDPPQEVDNHSITDGGDLWCEICETKGHDILNCTSMFGTQPQNQNGSPNSQKTGRDVVAEGLKGLKVTKHDDMGVEKGGMVAGKESGQVDTEKWCALCEREGHDSVDCPFDEF